MAYRLFLWFVDIKACNFLRMRNEMYRKSKFLPIRENKKIQYYVAYTICFLVITAAIFSVFVENGRSLVWTPDGLMQHFNALVYYRRWLLQIIDTLMTQHQLIIPLWDSTIGFGSDIITTLHYYVIGDPLTLLSVFVPKESQMEGFYSFLIILRIYLAGLAFSAYCQYHKENPFPTLLGALVYDFCFWVIVAVRHPYFLNPMIYMPLVLIGVDRIFKKKKPGLYIAMLALATVSNFYFAYMICIFVVIYTAIRYLMIYRKIQIRQLLTWIGRFVGYSLVALGIAATILLPVIAMTLSTGRADVASYLPTLYPLTYYIKLISGFLIGGSGYWSELGYTGLAVIGIFLLFMHKNRYRGLKLGLLILTLLLLFPMGGHILNGGSYVINRFMWVYSLLVSFIFVKMYPSSIHMQKKKKLALLAGGALYAILCIFAWMRLGQVYILVALGMFGAMLLLMVLTSQDMKQQPWFKLVLLVLVMGCLIYQGRVKYAPEYNNYVEEFQEAGTALDTLTNQAPGSLLNVLKDDSYYRYETNINAEEKNSAMQVGQNGVAYYFSLANPYINQFQRSVDLNQTRDFCYSGLDGRTILDLISCVKYYIIPSHRQDLLPYGYDQRVVTGMIANEEGRQQEYCVYANSNALPLGFATSSYIDQKEFQKLTATRKQQAYLQGAVVDTEELQCGTKLLQDLNFTDESIPYEIQAESGVEITDHTFTVTQEKAKVTLILTGLARSETYLLMEGLNYQDTATSSDVRSEDRVHINVSADNVTKKLTYLSRQNNFYSGIEDYQLNLGYRESGVTRITLSFSEKGQYSFDEMKVVCQPMSQVNEQLDTLQENTLDHVELGINNVTGEIALEQEKLLCVMLPFSTGWTAYIDGTEAKIVTVDEMYMGVMVPAGEHQLQFIYMTPYLKQGMMISLASIAVILLMGIIHWRYKKRKNNAE